LFEFLSINIHLKFTAIQIPIAKKGVGLSWAEAPDNVNFRDLLLVSSFCSAIFACAYNKHKINKQVKFKLCFNWKDFIVFFIQLVNLHLHWANNVVTINHQWHAWRRNT
jgi:hypothetical protein